MHGIRTCSNAQRIQQPRDLNKNQDARPIFKTTVPVTEHAPFFLLLRGIRMTSKISGIGRKNTSKYIILKIQGCGWPCL